jgi:hypothetical protein
VVVVADVVVHAVANGATAALVLHILYGGFGGGSDQVSLLLLLIMLFAPFDVVN